MIAVLILNYNSSDDLKACIDSIKRNCKEYCVVVVDNGSEKKMLPRQKIYVIV